jgi:anti-anti-sigma factor
MKIRIENKWGKISTICLEGDLDFSTSPNVRDWASRLIQKDTNQSMVDLSDVGYMESSRLASLIDAQQGSSLFSASTINYPDDHL